MFREWAHDSRGGVHSSRQTAMVGTLLPHVWPQQFSLIEASTTCLLLYLSWLKKPKHLQVYAAKFCLIWGMATSFNDICVHFDLLIIFPVYKLKDYLGGILSPPSLITPLFHFVFDRFFSPSTQALPQTLNSLVFPSPSKCTFYISFIPFAHFHCWSA